MTMFNSTIPRNKCKCSPDCDKWPTLSCYGYFFAHLPEKLAKKAGTRKALQIKNQNGRKVAAARLRADMYKATEVNKNELRLWYSLQMNSNERVCQNCGKSLNHYNDNDWRGSQHHIVDKSPLNGCPSIATNPLNHLVLGKWCCHSQWHTSFENASKMPCFTKAKERFELFKSFIAPEELRKVNPFLLI